MEQPLPYLSGPPLVPAATKRGRTAFILSIAGAALLFALPFLLVLLFVWGGRDSSTVPLAGREVGMDVIGAPFVLGSVGCSFAGFVLGATTRKTFGPKAVYIGGATLLVWLLIAGALGAAIAHSVNAYYFGRHAGG